MDAKVVRITMIPKAFPRSKKERILFIEPRYWLAHLPVRFYMNRIKYVSFCRLHNKTYVNSV